MQSIEEYRKAAKEKLPHIVEAYISGGAGTQPTDNADAFKNYIIRPYLATDTKHISTSTTMLGHHLSMPVCIAPMGNQPRVNKAAVHLTSAAAERCGVGFAMSAWSAVKMEDLEMKSGPKFFNLYIYPKRYWTENLVKIAEEHGFNGFVVGMAKFNPTNKSKSLGPSSYENLKQFGASTDATDADYPMPDQTATWADLTWLKSITSLPIILKGVLSARDALLAINAGVDAILVSNHGGRQLADVPAPIEVLPEIVSAVGKTCEVYLDGGVRSGADLFKALGLGARAVFIGRPILWGMACEGKEGMVSVLKIYKSELLNTMRLAGVRDVTQIPGDVVVSRRSVSRL